MPLKTAQAGPEGSSLVLCPCFSRRITGNTLKGPSAQQEKPQRGEEGEKGAEKTHQWRPQRGECDEINKIISSTFQGAAEREKLQEGLGGGNLFPAGTEERTNRG